MSFSFMLKMTGSKRETQITRCIEQSVLFLCVLVCLLFYECEALSVHVFLFYFVSLCVSFFRFNQMNESECPYLVLSKTVFPQ